MNINCISLKPYRGVDSTADPATGVRKLRQDSAHANAVATVLWWMRFKRPFFSSLFLPSFR